MKHDELINIDEANEFVVGGEALKTILCIEGREGAGRGAELGTAAWANEGASNALKPSLLKCGLKY